MEALLKVNKKHTLIMIGYLGSQDAYIDVSVDGARAKWIKEHGSEDGMHIEDQNITMIQFDDKFAVYDAWETE